MPTNKLPEKYKHASMLYFECLKKNVDGKTVGRHSLDN